MAPVTRTHLSSAQDLEGLGSPSVCDSTVTVGPKEGSLVKDRPPECKGTLCGVFRLVREAEIENMANRRDQ